MTIAPLKPALAAPEPASEALGLLTVGAIIAGAVLAKNMAGDLIDEAGAEAQDTLQEAERILDELIVKLRDNFEDALDVTLDKLDEFSRNQLALVHDLVQDLLIQFELSFERINETILEDIKFISLEIEARIAQVQDVAVVVVRGTILIIDKATFNLAFIIDLVILAVGLLVFIVLFFTRRLPTEPLSRRLGLGGMALFLTLFGIFLFPQGRAFALTFSGFGEQLQKLENPDIFQVRPDTIVIGETEEVMLIGTRLAPEGQPPSVDIGGVNAPVVTSNELVAVQVGGIDLTNRLGKQTIMLQTANGGVTTALIEVLAAPAPPPDLVISSFEIVPSTPVQDQNAQARITVHNQGTGQAEEFQVKWQPTAALIGDSQEVAGLGPGESRELAFNFSYISVGTFQTLAVADPFNQVEELDELNNTDTRQVTVRGEIIVTPIVIRTPQAPSCEAQCSADRNFCMNDGELLPRQCVQIYQACLARCP